MRRSNLKQLGDGFLRPDNVEFLQGGREIITGQGRDTASEYMPKRRTGLLAFVRFERVTRDAGAEYVSAVIAGILFERVFGCAEQGGVDRFARDCVPAANHSVGAAGQQRLIV